MPLTPSYTGGFNPLQAVATHRSAALSRILHFENLMHRRLGMVRPQRYVRLGNYYMQQNLPPDNVEQPLGINYFKSICDKHTAYLWGQYSDNVTSYRVKPRHSTLPEDNTSKKIQFYLQDMLEQNDANSLLWEAGLNGSVYGDSVLRLRWDPIERRVAIESLLPEWFHCRWDVANMNTLTEVIVSFPIDRLDAKERYNVTGNEAIDYNMVNPEYLPGFGIYWEHWTPVSYRIWIDDYLVEELPNPFMRYDDDGNVYPGIIPFIHVPNMRLGGEFYGFSDAENILSLQDEINRRMADMGDVVNNHAHPIVLLNKFNGQQRDLPIGPDAIWDLGREGEADYLQWAGTPPAVMEYIDLCKQMMYDTANMPEVAFGRGIRGGGSGKAGTSSGLALTLAMMPVVERAMQKRIGWARALRRLADITTFIHAVKDPATLPFAYSDFRDYEVRPIFADVLPRDRLQLVNEVVARTNSMLESIPSALEDLGEEDVLEEYKRIKADAKFKASIGMFKPPIPGGKNSDQGQGGSPGMQEGPGAPNVKAGAPAKDATGN